MFNVTYANFYSRLVPWLTAALQETLAQVAALAARVMSLEEQLGL